MYLGVLHTVIEELIMMAVIPLTFPSDDSAP